MEETTFGDATAPPRAEAPALPRPRRTAPLPTLLLRGAVAVAAAGAAWRLPLEFARFLSEGDAGWGIRGASDLAMRHLEVRTWLAGLPVYGAVESADYPPASHLILAPLVGWADFGVVRVLWAAATLAALAWLSLLMGRAAEPDRPADRWFLALAPLAAYATAASVRLGQFAPLLLPLLVAGVLSSREGGRGWARDLGRGGMFAVALVKPTFSVPLVCAAWLRGRWRPAALCVAAYGALTLAAAALQPASLPELVRGWLGQSGNIPFDEAHANLYGWLAALGAGDAWLAPASLLVLVLLAGWTWAHRDRDPWLLLGVSALVARFWTYHRHPDDLLVVVALVPLLHAARRSPDAASRRTSAVLLAALWGFSVAPASLLMAPEPWGGLFKAAKTATWLAALAWLVALARRPRPAEAACAG